MNLQKLVLLFAVSLLHSTALISVAICENGFYRYESTQTNQDALVYINLENKISEGWDNFHQAAFDVPLLMNNAQTQGLPVIFFVPPVFKDVSTISSDSPFTEGSRVALAWASTYCRFAHLGNVDVRIVFVKNPLEINDIKKVIEYCLKNPVHIDNTDTPETIIAKRISNYASLSLEPIVSDASLKELQLAYEEKSMVSICTDFLPQDESKKRFLITGAAGFLGSHLCRRLLAEGHQIIALDNFASSSKAHVLELQKNPDFYFVVCDVTQPFDIEGRIDYVVHLASVPSPEFYYKMPVETLCAGLHATKNALDLAVKKGAKFIISSTSEVYGDPEVSPQPEEYCGNVDPIGKRSQYDQSKRGAETLIKLYFDKYNLDVRIVRIFNIYGPGMRLHDGRVVTNFIDAILNNKSIKIYGDGTQSRSFGYVSDMIDGMYSLIINETLTNEILIEKRIVNIGNPNEFTINELARAINSVAKLLGLKEAPIEYYSQIDTTDPKKRCPDITRAKKLLNFHPRIELREGLEKTLRHFQTSM